jgi:2-oxoisovalerate dehydrogenase E1 component
VFGVTRGLQKEFGQGRVFDTPISESAILGSAVGASIRGARPVVEIMWADFLLVALDQLVNQAANVRYLSNGAQCAPLVVRTQQGVTPGSCAQHSQSLEALLAHVPGLKVGLPSTAHDAYMMTRAAIADDDPVVLIESRALYLEKDVVDVEARPEKVGGARLRRAGRDVLLISWGRMVHECDAAADLLAAQGIRAGVLDLRWLAPLDFGTVKEQAVAHGGKVVVVHEANRTGGFGAELAARLNEDAFEQLDGPVVRVAAPDVRWPAAPSLQAALLPESKSIARAAAALCEY